MIQPGDQVGSYRVLEPIGKGGMGMVFRAEHVKLPRRVALKVLHAELAADTEAVARFINEAEVVNRIGHEHIVDITDFGTTPDGECYFVMEYLDGESLAQRLRQAGPFDTDRALHVAWQLADALAASHQAGVAHRDLKPGNVLLIKRGGDPDYVKLIDFGLAKLLTPSGPGHLQTRTGEVRGTPHYMSPEQCRGIRAGIDERTDIYSLGIVLYELLTAEPPFQHPNITTLMFMHMAAPMPDVRTRRPGVPADVAAVVERATRKKAEDRYASMVEMRQVLRELS
jgi:serine/threonine-protein kinase